MRRLACLLALVTTAVATAQAPRDADDIVRDMIGERPGADAGPTRVTVGLYVLDINRVDDVNQSFTADFVFRVSWHDPRLAADVSGMRTFSLSEIWSPDLTVINKRRLWPSWDDVLNVDPAGNVLYRQRFWGQLTARLNLRDFPFDRNQLKIQIVAPQYGPEDIEFVIDETVTGHAPEFSLVDAAISKGHVGIDTFYFAPSAANMAELTYEFDIQRYKAYFLWKVILPLAIIVMMSWLVFWMDPGQLGPQIGLSATALLTLIAYRFLLGNLVPRVSYLTRLDIFILGATILVFLGLVEAIVKAYLAAGRHEQRAQRIDRWARVLFPAAFVIVTYVAFFAR